MIFGFLGKRKRAKDESDRKAREAEAKEEEEKAAKKRHEQSLRIRDNLQAARDARAAQDAAEAEACQTIGLTRASTDTKVRKMKVASDEISSVIRPKNGQSVADMALEAYEAECAAEKEKKEGTSV